MLADITRPGIFFETLEGYTYSDAETVASTGFHRAILSNGSSTTEGIYFVSDITASPGEAAQFSMNPVYNLVCMPYKCSWVTGSNASYFDDDLAYSSGRFGNLIEIHSESGGSYPLSIALKGYRIMTSSYWYRTYYTATNMTVAINCQCWGTVPSGLDNNPPGNIDGYYVSSSSSRTIYLSNTYYQIDDGRKYSWNRHWVGVTLQAGGAAGGDAWLGHDGAGGGAGACWVGLLNLDKGTIRIAIEGYSAVSDAKLGSGIRVYAEGYSSPMISVTGGYNSRTEQKGMKAGGSVSYGSGFSGWYKTYRSKSGGRGSGTDIKGDLGTGVNNYTLEGEVPDMPNIYFGSTYGGVQAQVNTGSGGGSVYGTGGQGLKNQGENVGRGYSSLSPRYGAGGGGSAGAGGATGGSGGYPLVIIGY